MRSMKPKALRPGDTVGIVSPSWGGAARFPWVLDRAIENLRKYFRLSVKEFPHTRADPDHLYHHPEDRARDVMTAFEDPEVVAVVSVIGGDDSMRVLPYLDPGVFRRHPKVFLGYSDTTTLLSWANLQGLVTFHGPSMLAGWSQMSRFPESFQSQARAVLFGSGPPLKYTPFSRYSEGYPDWGDRANVGKVNRSHPNGGPHWLSGKRTVSGPLWGGNIEVLEMLKGTRYWPPPSFWKGRVLFLETSEEVPPVRAVRRWLRNYALEDVFLRSAGLLFGRARGYTSEQKRELDRTITEVLFEEYGVPEMPVVTNLDFGHTDPQWILPLGIPIRVDPVHRTLALTESPTLPSR